MNQRRSDRGRDDGRQQRRGNGDARPVVVPPQETHHALPAPGTATAVASGAAGPARPVLPYERHDEQREGPGDGNGRRGDNDRPAPDAGSSRDGGREGRPDPGRDSSQGHDDEIPHDLKKPETFWVVVVLATLVVLLGVLFAVGFLPRLRRNKQLNADAKSVEQAPPTVNAARPRRAQAVTDLVLPGTVQAWQDTGIYARVTGYVKEWRHDLGDYVAQGDVLAVIEAPDVDQQLQQSQAQLGQSRATLQKSQADLELAKVTLDRFENLFKIKAINEQQLDQTRDAYASAQSTLDQTKATIARDEANVRQFTEEQSWERVTAPFNGRVTARNVNVGQLIMPGTTATNSGGGREMFHIVAADVVRVMITVPQTFVNWLQPGQDAEVFFRDDPRRGIKGNVSRFSGALDPSSRTLLTEVDVPNKGLARTLTPGMALQVKFSVKRNVPPLMVPESALIFNAQDTQLVVVRQTDGKATAHFQPIVMGRDTGAEIEVISGLDPGDIVVTNPGERLVEGGPVKVATIAPPRPDDKKSPGELGTPGAGPATKSAGGSTGATAATEPSSEGDIVIPPMTMPPDRSAPPARPTTQPMMSPASQPALSPTPASIGPGTG